MSGSGRPTSPSAVVEHYLDRLVAHEWAAVAACLADDVVRIGPFGDVYAGRERYVSFLAELMPTLGGYAMEVHRIRPVASHEDDGPPSPATVLAELTETVALDGEAVDTAELLVFDVDPRLLITRISIFVQRT